MPSITSWTQLKSYTRSEDIQLSLQARIHDPLWLLARQWQTGEFKGEDAGSPVIARIRAEVAPLTHYRAGANGTASTVQPYNSGLPLETLVEREPIRRGTIHNLRHTVEAGLHFLRLLDIQGASAYRRAYLDRYPLHLTAQEQAQLDPASLRFLHVMSRRAPDGIRLYADLRTALRPAPNAPKTLPPEPVIAANHRPTLIQIAETWLNWYETFFSEPLTQESAWNPERIEYALSVAAATTQGEQVLSASEYTEGHLDWYSFNVDRSQSLGAGTRSNPTLITRTVIPSPVTYRGMPLPRWWELEDAQVNFGALAVGSNDLIKLLFLEFALVYGNDWFVIPVEMNIGSLSQIQSLVVTDTFGERLLIRPVSQIDDPNTPWRMFCLGRDRTASNPNAAPSDELFFLPPVLTQSLHGTPIEEVLFLRDEMGNMAWAVEKIVKSAIEKPLDRFEIFQAQRRSQQGELPATVSTSPLTYQLASDVPDYWFPLLPVQQADRSMRLQRGRMLRRPEQTEPEIQGQILAPERQLSLFDEEVSRAGSLVTRAYQYTRWIDGSTHLWIGRSKRPGRGEGFSGLQFDVVQPVLST